MNDKTKSNRNRERSIDDKPDHTPPEEGCGEWIARLLFLPHALVRNQTPLPLKHTITPNPKLTCVFYSFRISAVHTRLVPLMPAHSL